jgi:hypothetical protein
MLTVNWWLRPTFITSKEEKDNFKSYVDFHGFRTHSQNKLLQFIHEYWDDSSRFDEQSPFRVRNRFSNSWNPSLHLVRGNQVDRSLSLNSPLVRSSNSWSRFQVSHVQLWHFLCCEMLILDISDAKWRNNKLMSHWNVCPLTHFVQISELMLDFDTSSEIIIFDCLYWSRWKLKGWIILPKI